ncbi:MAG: SDR family oxidoreductase [Trueperaceae bacterium]|jgi:NAD(P)-dependent dehydrogenase (short-subunit alcohol dehydrogenase family)|nr:SDR family oxidoreductase [Trueperaceae bacterium]
MDTMTGKVALVTGAGSGIGRAVALEFAAKGAAVMVADFNLTGAEETVRQVVAGGGRAAAVKVDVADEASVKEMVAATVATFGRVDYLVNNAGISAAGPNVPLHEVEVEAFKRVLDVNVVGTFLGLKHAIPELLKVGGGGVVNLASTMGDRATAGDPSYPTSKHAVRGLTKSAALTYATAGVRVNCVGPGVVRTGMTEAIFADEQTTAWLKSVTPMRRFGEPAEIAKLIVFLCSEDASYITGAYYPIDGGWLAG